MPDRGRDSGRCAIGDGHAGPTIGSGASEVAAHRVAAGREGSCSWRSLLHHAAPDRRSIGPRAGRSRTPRTSRPITHALPAEAVDPTVPRDAPIALRRSRQAVPGTDVAWEPVLGAGVLRHAGPGRVGGQATNQPGIARIGIVGALVAEAPFTRAARGLARAEATDTDGHSTTGIIKAAAVALVGAAVRPVAVAVPIAHQWGIRAQALAARAARFARSRPAMTRRGL